MKDKSLCMQLPPVCFVLNIFRSRSGSSIWNFSAVVTLDCCNGYLQEIRWMYGGLICNEVEQITFSPCGNSILFVFKLINIMEAHQELNNWATREICGKLNKQGPKPQPFTVQINYSHNLGVGLRVFLDGDTDRGRSRNYLSCTDSLRKSGIHHISACGCLKEVGLVLKVLAKLIHNKCTQQTVAPLSCVPLHMSVALCVCVCVGWVCETACECMFLCLYM